MRSNTQSTWKTSKVHDFVGGVLRRHFSLTDFGRTCTVNILLAVWLLAATRRLSLSAAAEQLQRAPSDETVRKATRQQLPSMRELERQLNAALCDRLPASLRRKRLIWAIDLTEKPYYGKSQGIGPQLRRGPAKRGTTRFHVFASLYVVHRGERFTLAVTYVWRKDTLPDILARLIAAARKRGLRPKFLLLDRQFYNVEVVLFLKRHRLPFLMPVVHRGRRAKDPTQAKGTQQFLAWQRSGRCNYTMRNKEQTAEVIILVAVDDPASKKGRRGKGKRGRRVLVFAAWGFQVRSPAWARETYRRRFGIETSYRQANQAQAWTTSRSGKLRLLLFGLALLLRNAWVWLHRSFFSRELPNGAFVLQPEQLRFMRLLIHLEHEILLLLGLSELDLPVNHSRSPPSPKFGTTDASCLPFDDGTFDLAWCAQSPISFTDMPRQFGKCVASCDSVARLPFWRMTRCITYCYRGRPSWDWLCITPSCTHSGNTMESRAGGTRLARLCPSAEEAGLTACRRTTYAPDRQAPLPGASGSSWSCTSKTFCGDSLPISGAVRGAGS